MNPFLWGATGAVTVLLLARLVRRAVWRHHFRHGGLRRAGPPFFLRRLFHRLGTKPEQEAVVTAEADALAAELRAFRADAHALRAELGDLVAGPALDADAVKAALASRLERLEAVKARAAEGVARIHAALEPAQRAELAAMLRRGPHGRHHHHRCGPRLGHA